MCVSECAYMRMCVCEYHRQQGRNREVNSGTKCLESHQGFKISRLSAGKEPVSSGQNNG